MPLVREKESESEREKERERYEIFEKRFERGKKHFFSFSCSLFLSFSPRPSPPSNTSSVTRPCLTLKRSTLARLEVRSAGGGGGGSNETRIRISIAMRWDSFLSSRIVLLSLPPFHTLFASQYSRLRELAQHKDSGTHAVKLLIAPAARGETHSAEKDKKKRMLTIRLNNQSQATPRRLRATLASSTPSRPSWTPSWACPLVSSRRCRSR